jgi:hypothetical protein
MRIQLDQDLHEIRQQVTGVLEQVGRLADIVDRIAKTVDDHAPAGAIWWPDLDGAEGSKRWGELEMWIVDVLRARYPEQAKSLPECWDEHPAMIDAVTAGWLAWLAAYKAPGKLTGPITWQADITHGMPAMAKALDAVPCMAQGHRR